MTSFGGNLNDERTHDTFVLDSPMVQLKDQNWADDNIRYVVITGGVLSGIGKGVTTSSIGAILKAHGHRVTALKIDPYLNTDAGTMSPFEHGEVYVLDDGGEVDLDLGNYERMMDLSLRRENNLTTGKIYRRVIERERRGDYLGKTVQVIPHVVNEIMDWIRRVAHTPTDGTNEKPEFCVIELGGTVGDIESMPFVEALRQFQFKVGWNKFCLVHVSLVPLISDSQKTKPTQHSVKELRALGLSPDIIACRCEKPLEEGSRERIALHCQVKPESVISIHNVPNLFRVPMLMESQGFTKMLMHKFNLPYKHDTSKLQLWDELAAKEEKATEEVRIALVGKYTDFQDAYLSVVKALQHAAIAVSRKLNIVWIEASDLEKIDESGSAEEVAQRKEKNKAAWKKMRSADGILVPGGFGDRGIDGKILAANWARKSGIPYLGICLGMQVAVIEFARTVLGYADANSEEFDGTTKHKVLIYMPEISKTHMGGTMRLGARDTIVQAGSLASALYGGKTVVSERHRHRYEVNPEVVQAFEEKGFSFVGKDEEGKRMEVIEIKSHPFFVGTQYHPEFNSTPIQPSPPFYGLLLASSGQMEKLHALVQAHSKPNTNANNTTNTNSTPTNTNTNTKNNTDGTQIKDE